MMHNRIDQILPDAPLLARRGPLPMGVRTDRAVNPNQPDVARWTASHPRYDRPLTIEIWYPAAQGTVAGGSYATLLRDGQRPITLHGQAARDAAPAMGCFPLVILSHGYPGNRMLLAHFAESLVGHGYVVASIDHTDSTYSDKGAFGSTLVNRPLDTRFVVDWLAQGHPLSPMIDSARYAILGYSMGGYGALISGGAGLSDVALQDKDAPPDQLLNQHRAPIPSIDPRLRAIVPIGAWGRQAGFWDAAGLAGLRVPALMIAGTQDHISGYDTGLRKIFDESCNANRHLLGFDGAGHNAAAPFPAPVESFDASAHLPFLAAEHYADPVWDTLRMNNIAQHFVRAFLDLHLKGQEDQAAFLDGSFKGLSADMQRGLIWESAPAASAAGAPVV